MMTGRRPQTEAWAGTTAWHLPGGGPAAPGHGPPDGERREQARLPVSGRSGPGAGRCGQPMSGRAHARETAASAAQYLLLGGFTAVAAGISAQGLTGFARDNMGLRGPWPYLLFLALDGAAGVCAVLLTRRAARAESGLAPRLAVWGLVAASASFNATHAPRRPGAPEAFGLMPVIAAVLFEFTLRELRQRAAGRADRQMAAVRWLYPAERIRVQRLLAADEHISAQAATRRVRIEQAARRLYQLRCALHARDRAARPGAMAARRARIAERRAHAALIRAGFSRPGHRRRRAPPGPGTHPDCAPGPAGLHNRRARAGCHRQPDHRRPAARPGITGPAARRSRRRAQGPPAHGCRPRRPQPAQPSAARTRRLAGKETAPADSQQAAAGHDADHDGEIIAAAAGILVEARRRGERLSQKALGGKLRRDGYRVANRSLRGLLAAASGQIEASSPPAPGKTPGGPAVAAHLVNGSHPALASRLPGHEPGPGAAGPAWRPVMPPRPAAPRAGPGGRAPAEAGRAPRPPARGRPGIAYSR